MSLKNAITTHRVKVTALAVLTCLFSWLAMQVVHEFGHILHAWVSGGKVAKVVLHPFTISRTDVSPNPHPLFVVWGGPIWGCLLPLLAHLFVNRVSWNHRHLVSFFSGFCLIANGAYLGVGVLYPVGDAEVLMALGTPNWILILFGLSASLTGLWLWHGLGKPFGLGKSNQEVDTKEVVSLVILNVLIVAVELALSQPV